MVLQEAYKAPFSPKSNFARYHADDVAIASTDGLLSVMVPGVGFSRRWRVTVEGLIALKEYYNDE
mgnify:CR=1 FL=1